MFRGLMFVAVLLFGGAHIARADEPQIYYFGATGCEFCADGLRFLGRWAARDDKLRVATFDVVSNDTDAGVFVTLTRAIGLNNPQVPMTVIGRHIIIGYESDAATGAEIVSIVEACRRSTCPDVVHVILNQGSGANVVSSDGGWVIEQRFATAAAAARAK